MYLFYIAFDGLSVGCLHLSTGLGFCVYCMFGQVMWECFSRGEYGLLAAGFEMRGGVLDMCLW